MDDKDNIASKDINIDKTVYQILNEAYHEFKQTYGEKHSGHIKELIESITDKVKIAPHYYSGAIASAHSEMGVVYTKSDKLSAVLKHEMWHIYNNSAQDREKSLQYIPERYMEQLESNGYLRKTYQTTMEEYKEKWKDEPERLEFLLIDYEKYKNERFDFDDSPVEMWTEWFNSKTHLKDMQDNFWDWGDGYYTKSHSSDSFYDSYINIADMISCIIPKEKLLEMYLQTTDYKTDYSYPEMLEEFDTKYAEALNESEKEEYKYPYLKMILDVKTISDNARKNPTVAREALQSCMTTCFNSYLIKLNNIQEMDMEKAQNIYSEIKYMQEQMVWNTDISKMQELDYTKAMEKIQEKFKQLMQEMDIEKPEVQNMLETIDYKESNPYVFIENGEEISKKIIETQNDDKGQLVNINGYRANIGTTGIKGNLYSSLFTLIEDKKYNLSIIEYKPTKPKNDDFHYEDAMQMFAQKICVDSVFCCDCKCVLYYADVKKRIELPIRENYNIYDKELKSILSQMQEYLKYGKIPAIKHRQYCGGCSMKDVCMPLKKPLKSIRKQIEEIGDIE